MSDENITAIQEQEDTYDYDSIWKDFTRDFGLGLLTDEQIADTKKKSPKEIVALRNEIKDILRR